MAFKKCKQTPTIKLRWNKNLQLSYKLLHYLPLSAAIVVCILLLSAGCTSPRTGSSGPTTTQPTIVPVGPTTIVPPTAPKGPVLPIPPAAYGPSVSFDLVAENMSFNMSTITVPAGSVVTIHFFNRESGGSSQVTGIAHNFAVYETSAAKETIFSGDIITGGGDDVYTFTAPSVPGIYFFRCDIHPALMNGTFIVE